MIRWILFMATIVGLEGISAVTLAADPRSQPTAEFDIAPDGDFVLLPVVINQHEYPFMVSTGLVTTVIDNRLREKIELTRLERKGAPGRGGQGHERFGLSATLGNIPLELPDGVEAGDFDVMHEKLDLECSGEMGMDVLRRFVVQIDFDEGKLRLLHAVPPGAGESLRITPMGADGGAPLITVTIPAIPAIPSEKFILHTSRAANSLELSYELFARLQEKEKLTVLDPDKGVTRSAGFTYQSGRLHAVQIGKSRHEDLFVNTAEHNVIGLAYLSRYIVTFDFPRNRLYWKHGRHFDDPDNRMNLADLALKRDQGAVTFCDDPQGTAGRLGLRRGDVLETLNGRDVRRISNWQIRRVLGRERGTITAVVRRGGERLTLQTELPQDSAEKSIDEAEQ
jgi:hypothetical protein